MLDDDVGYRYLNFNEKDYYNVKYVKGLNGKVIENEFIEKDTKNLLKN